MVDMTRFTALVRSFHSMEEAPVEPKVVRGKVQSSFDAHRFDDFAVGTSSGGRYAGAFLLSVWHHGKQTPAELLTDHLCKYFRDTFRIAQERIGALEDQRPTAALRKALRATEEGLNEVRHLYTTGAHKEAHDMLGRLTTQDAELGRLVESMRRQVGMPAEPPRVGVAEVLQKLHEGCPWRCGPFVLGDALGTWDGRHRDAFLAWARAPWWM